MDPQLPRQHDDVRRGGGRTLMALSPEEPKVTLQVEMTPEDYVAIKKNSDWEGQSVAKYLVDNAMGRTRRGC